MSYLRFVDAGIPEGQKTRRYTVYGTGSNSLGQIRFYGAWRKFCFFPNEMTTFDSTCLTEISDFCQHQNDLRRQE